MKDDSERYRTEILSIENKLLSLALIAPAVKIWLIKNIVTILNIMVYPFKYFITDNITK